MAATFGWRGALLAALMTGVAQAKAASPDRAFLEYLAGMVEEDGQWVDPLAMTDLDDSSGGQAKSDGENNLEGPDGERPKDAEITSGQGDKATTADEQVVEQ